MPTVTIPGVGETEVSDQQAEAVSGIVESDSGNSGITDRIIDVPADFVNASTGTGENLGWFGVVDRALDYRVWTGEMNVYSPEWANPNDQTTGLSGAVAAAGQQAGAAGEDAAQGLWATLKQSPVLLIGAVVAVAVLLRPYAGAVT
jgi:hypothetical protein